VAGAATARARDGRTTASGRNAGVQELPIQELPIQELPIQELPIQELPIQELPIQELPFQELPINIRSGQWRTSRFDRVTSAYDAVDGSAIGTPVPWMWAAIADRAAASIAPTARPSPNRQ
jgi:hypothetical protein